MKEVLSVFVPTAIGYVSTILIELINVTFVGHLGEAELIAGVGLGNMYFNPTALAVMIGLNNGVSTFVS